MTSVLAIVNGMVLTVIALLHGYWMLGGRRGLDVALPNTETGEGPLKTNYSIEISA